MTFYFIIPVYGALIMSSAPLHIVSQPYESEIMKPIFQRNNSDTGRQGDLSHMSLGYNIPSIYY